MSKKGIFITLEGGEGTGKSTQVKLLAEALVAAGIDAVTTREPGGTPEAERIRALIVQRDGGDYDPLTEALLISAARREHLVNKILPGIAKGQWIISDRFADSTRAMQGYGYGDKGVALDALEDIYKIIAGEFQPALTFILDIDPELGLARAAKRLTQQASTEDKFERMSLAFHQRLRQGFLDTAKKFPNRCVIIEAAQDVQSVHRQILKVIETRLGVACKEAAHG